jgi:hypothetical protein
MKIKKELFKKVCYNIFENLKKNEYFKFEDLHEAIKKSAEIIQFNSLDKKIISYFRQGNLKLAQNVLIWSMPSGVACGCNCAKCYAKKAERLYKNTRVMRLYKMILIEYALLDKDFYIELQKRFINELEYKTQNKSMLWVLRVHESGDFYKKEYLNFWLEIIKQVENIENLKIYTYTKVLNNHEVDLINNSYKNFNIVKSFIELDKKYMNFGNNEYLQDLSNKLKEAKKDFYICDYGAKTSHAICMGNCTKCLNCSHVLFHEH